MREKSAFGHVTQVALCAVGLHVSPPRRPSHGPIVADCRRCGKTCYFHGLSTAGLGGPPMLVPLVVRELPAHSSR
ncbi:MAG TPA: hypothetical protein VLH79_08595 [Chthonomonadales bacterium]|nr:hypothetical protein [Chthonomonadales bacterium]